MATNVEFTARDGDGNTKIVSFQKKQKTPSDERAVYVDNKLNRRLNRVNKPILPTPPSKDLLTWRGYVRDGLVERDNKGRIVKPKKEPEKE
jgi:hypothetical protein